MQPLLLCNSEIKDVLLHCTVSILGRLSRKSCYKNFFFFSGSQCEYSALLQVNPCNYRIARLII